MARVRFVSGSTGWAMGTQLEVGRCPNCSIASPRLTKAWGSDGAIPRTDGGEAESWAVYLCSVCGGATTVRATASKPEPQILAIYPGEKFAHEDLPDVARKFLQQAYETLHAPDASTVMAASAVDAMLKAKGYSSGSLYQRIDEALANNVLTQGMATWAHSVRLEANGVRHADAAKPHATAEEAAQAVEFAEALGNFLFVLTARVERGIQAAQSA